MSQDNSSSQLDLSLTSMEWLPQITVNKQLTNIDLNTNGLDMMPSPKSPSVNNSLAHGNNDDVIISHHQFATTTMMTTRPIINMTSTSQMMTNQRKTTKSSNSSSSSSSSSSIMAQRAEPHRPVDLTAEHRGNCSELNRREGKPPYSYVNLITFAINSTSKKRMTLNEIYEWISTNFHYYRNAGNGWKNSIRHNLSLNKCFARVQRTKDDPGKGSYWTIDNNYQEIALSNPTKIRQKIESGPPSETNSNSNTSDSPQSNAYNSPSQSPHQALRCDQMLPCLSSTSTSSNSSSSSSSSSSSTNSESTNNHLQLPSSFMDNNPLFDDLNASFKKLFKSITDNRDAFEIELQNCQHQQQQQQQHVSVMNELNDLARPHQLNYFNQQQQPHQQQQQQFGHTTEPTLNTINSVDFNASFDNFVQGIKLASNGEMPLNINDIDMSQFKSLVESMRYGDKNNWYMSSNKFVDFASSLSNFFVQSGIMQRVVNNNNNNNNKQETNDLEASSQTKTGESGAHTSTTDPLMASIGDLKKEDIYLLKAMSDTLKFSDDPSMPSQETIDCITASTTNTNTSTGKNTKNTTNTTNNNNNNNNNHNSTTQPTSSSITSIGNGNQIKSVNNNDLHILNANDSFQLLNNAYQQFTSMLDSHSKLNLLGNSMNSAPVVADMPITTSSPLSQNNHSSFISHHHPNHHFHHHKSTSSTSHRTDEDNNDDDFEDEVNWDNLL